MRSRKNFAVFSSLSWIAGTGQAGGSPPWEDHLAGVRLPRSALDSDRLFAVGGCLTSANTDLLADPLGDLDHELEVFS